MSGFVFTGGGTGGHLLPAIAVARALEAERPGVAVTFLGPANRGERRAVEAAGLPFEEVPAAAIRGRSPVGLLRSLLTLLRGTVIALRHLRRLRPAAVFSTGGYGSFPVSLAAWLLRRPLVVFLPDVVPGLAVRVEQRLATRIATSTPRALDHLPAGKTAVTGYPVRPEFFALDRVAARAALGIPPADSLVVVAGASQGARAINEAVFAGLESLLHRAYLVHVTGDAGYAEAARRRDALPPALRERYLPAAFRDDLPAVMLAADLGVFRAGASILGELPAAALPAILVPGTFAGGHQRDNARWLTDHGAARLVEEADLAALPGLVAGLLDDPAALAAMREASAALARPDAAAAIARILLEVAK
ncbi:UDP-N-acetylglucosamine--N-acetylmuramyl-(pentapeptide) pyrophosphoryl-undecaprenol N-acetylglucosamine transferase [Tepidiforma sp.]|uniref:UDP-N-acetylglucosamine--N-acetylmuramyl- (pentapeptide) pyrophosphoryl-undecaprenol N-acetylglucosamine transferase n=1 Tax=Tepidiforma sp. TaxID=2682230 RepID=UPI002ADE17FC|nr:glycosyltransferase [Tepidiforma sp.]